MEVTTGDVDYNAKDDKGQVISPEAAEHMAEFRVRCSFCEQNFCCGCNEQPYHTGMTCQQLEKYRASKKCRFCGDMIDPDEEVKYEDEEMAAAFSDVCHKQECRDLIKDNCCKVLACGHPCRGFFGEKQCLPCLNEDCAEKARQEAKEQGIKNSPNTVLEGITEDSFCTICWISELSAEPCVKLGCGHVFHINCIKTIIENKWTSARITFSFMDCPSCKQPMELDHCAPLAEALAEAKKVKEEIKEMALVRAKNQELDKDPRLSDPNDHFYNDLAGFAMFKCAFYNCAKCTKPYFGGMIDCGDNNEGQINRDDLICGKCAALNCGAGVTNCEKHGQEFIDYKCRFCCNIALFFCFGTTHYCKPCHDNPYVRIEGRPLCNGEVDKCQLGLKHPEEGTEFALGCGLCRSRAISD